MGLIHGSVGKHTINAVDMTGFIKTSEWEEEPDLHDVTHGGATAKSYQSGLTDAKLKVEGTYDDQDIATGPRDTIKPLIGGAAFPVLRDVEGTGSGNARESFNAVVAKYGESGSVDGMVKWKLDLQVSGVITITDQA